MRWDSHIWIDDQDMSGSFGERKLNPLIVTSGKTNIAWRLEVLALG